ncbi:MAG: hypothetical protein ABSB24_02150 [Gaiellaceae bacterium]|jgi:hypothetical protein
MGKRTVPIIAAFAALVAAAPCWAKPPVTAPAPTTSLSAPQTARVGAKVTLWFKVHDPLAVFSYNVQVSAGTKDGRVVANTGSILIQHKTQALGSFVWTPKAKGAYTACVVAMDFGALGSRAIGYSCKPITVR